MKISINKLQQIPRILFTITLFSILAACGGSSSSTPAAPPVDPTDATLKTLSLSIGALDPVFGSADDKGTYTIQTNKADTTITAVANQASATLEIKNGSSIHADASKPIVLSLGSNTITTTVTSPDKTIEKTYTITITRLSADASLSALTLTGGKLSPVFSSDVMEYALTTNDASTDVTATVNQDKANIKINNADATSINLNLGSNNTISIIVTAEDGKTTQAYRITVTYIKASPTDASLSGLVLSSVSNLAFASDTIDYTLTTSAISTTVTAIASQTNATFEIKNGETVHADASAPIDLALGSNTITITVTAPDTTTQKTYTITITRLSADASLSALTLTGGTLSPAFSSDVMEYAFATTEDSIDVTAIVNQDKASIEINTTDASSNTATYTALVEIWLNATSGTAINLPFSNNFDTISIIVTAENGSIQTYSISVTRIKASPTDASLLSLVLSADSFNPAFASDTIDYNLTTSATSTTVTAIASQTNATFEIKNGETVHADASAPIALALGSNIITITVTAPDTTTQKTYTITITRLGADASLSALTLTGGKLSPVFASDVMEYALTTTADSTNVTATVNQDKATVEVDDTTVTLGSASGKITLTAGAETSIKVVVTAEDGTSKKTYTITVHRVADLELINPSATDTANQKFGQKVVQLGNGNIVVHAPGYGTDKGAVHFYKPTSSKAVASFYGINTGDQVGSGGIIALANDNFLIVSPFEDKGGLGAAGSVRLVNGATGQIINTIITGDGASDVLASGGITLLNNNQFVITSPNYKNNGQPVGLVQVIDDQGKVIKTLYGNEFGITRLGNLGVTALTNNNFVIVSGFYTLKGQSFAGIVHLVDSEYKVTPITGQGKKPLEFFGGSGITPLKDGNFLIATQTHDANDSLTNAGSIQLINGDNGETISTLIGNKKDGYLGRTSGSGRTSDGKAATTTITPLGNNNYVVLHHTADNGTVKNAGSIRLFNGADGEEIKTATATGTPVFGSYAHDFVKQDLYITKITVLKNHNFVVTAPHSDKQGNTQLITSAGSIRLINGVSGAQIGVVQEGEDSLGDYLGNGDTIELSNGKYVVSSPQHSNDGKITNGLVSVFNDKGEAPERLVGDKAFDVLGDGGLTAVGNNKFVIASTTIERNDITFAGSIQLVDASDTKTKNIKEISGDNTDDFSPFGGVTRLSNHNFVFALPKDNVTVPNTSTRIPNGGSVQVVNSTTGDVVQKILGAKAGDMDSVQMITPVTAGDYFILSQPLADDNDKVDVGRVRLVVPTFPTNN